MFGKTGRISILLFLALGVGVVAARTMTTTASSPGAPDPQALTAASAWMRWDDAHNALTADGDTIWSGGSFGARQIDLSDNSATYYNQLNGMPFAMVYAIAVDGDGSVWFGHDVGLSRLDSSGTWHHFTAATSGMASGAVNAVAVGAEGSVWTRHQPDGQVSHRRPDGTWVVFDSAESAVEAAYAQVLTTLNHNDLWAVSGSEVWFGSAVRVAPDGTVWEMSSWDLSRWDGTEWTLYEVPEFAFEGQVQALAIGPDGEVWIGWEERTGPYSNRVAGISHFDPDADALEWGVWPGKEGPVGALLVTVDGPWAGGGSWTYRHDTETSLYHAPFFQNVTSVVIDANGDPLVHSDVRAPYAYGIIEPVKNGATLPLDDDVWSPRENGAYLGLLDALEVAPGGSVWASGHTVWRFDIPGPSPLLQFTESGLYDYELPDGMLLRDIFALDERTVWMVAAEKITSNWPDYDYDYSLRKLDTGGTVDDQTDDVWTPLALPADMPAGSVAVDVFGRIWYASAAGLMVYDDDAWQTVSPLAYSELTVAPDGTVFALSGSTVVTLAPDGQQTAYDLGDLIRSRADLIRLTIHHNSLWTIAPDGAVWWWEDDTLIRLGNDDIESHYPLSDMPSAVIEKDSIAVDAQNHLWFVAEGDLLRWAPQPDYVLPNASWWVERGATRTFALPIGSVEGCSALVDLTVAPLPVGVSASFALNPIAAGSTAYLELTVAPDAQLGEYSVMLVGDSTAGLRTVDVSLRIVADLHLFYLPLSHR